ncbi:hypothetical protein HFN_0962 [Helicobacter fennelliae MRY12-0050]|uniref:Uncharacterized protein n=1 Tax=Helicobacter fennelliae MRY12-0050 TaxID=1325130 RepID=T1DWU7_9HELI|nr:hypothetical protein HFN_0962 [Helicobacter fennelliae MRY12-0050]
MQEFGFYGNYIPESKKHSCIYNLFTFYATILPYKLTNKVFLVLLFVAIYRNTQFIAM